MLQIPAIITGFILIFVLVSGLVVLWRRGAEDLDSWGLFVTRVLRGDRPVRKLPRDHKEEQGVNPELSNRRGRLVPTRVASAGVVAGFALVSVAP